MISFPIFLMILFHNCSDIRRKLSSCHWTKSQDSSLIVDYDAGEGVYVKKADSKVLLLLQLYLPLIAINKFKYYDLKNKEAITR